MSDNCQIKNNKQSNVHSIFTMPAIMTLCEKFYYLSKEDTNYYKIMEKIKSLSSCSEKDLSDCRETLSHEFPILNDLITYISISQDYFKKLRSEHNALSLPIDKIISIHAYAKCARHILELMENDYVSRSNYEHILSPLYPLQHKILCFNKELIEKCVKIYETYKKSSPDDPYPSQVNFDRILNKFHSKGLDKIEEILFPECTKQRKRYRIPVCSVPSVTYIFLMYHQTFLPAETRFSVWADAFINIAVSRETNLPSILKVLYILKNGFENSKHFSQNDTDKLPCFFQEPGNPPVQNNLSAWDNYLIHTHAFKEYDELFNKYSSKIEFLKTFRKIEKRILDAYVKWTEEPENKMDLDKLSALAKKLSKDEGIVFMEIKAKNFVKYLEPVPPFFNITLSDLEEPVDQFLVKFQYAARRYAPVQPEDLIHLPNTLHMLDLQMFHKLECLIYSPSTADTEDFFALSPLS
ncbi:MAG: hypothetical protein HFH49_13060 [Lachnospiraceae bacterium]|nr:hypothetical protein [Lachnospiraceae bacterium]